MTFKLSIWYAGTDTDEPAQTQYLTAAQVEAFIRPETGFLHDMLYLEGQGVRKLMLEVA